MKENDKTMLLLTKLRYRMPPQLIRLHRHHARHTAMIAKFSGEQYLSRFGMTPHKLLGHTSNAFALLGYACTEVLPFRLLMLCGTVTGIAFNYKMPAGPIWLACGWGCIFASINGSKIAKLLMDRNSTFTEAELVLYDEIFSLYDMSTLQFRKLMDLSSGRLHVRRGEMVAREGAPQDKLYLVLSGTGSSSLHDEHNVKNMKRRRAPTQLHHKDTPTAAAAAAAAEKAGLAHTEVVRRGAFIGDVAFSRRTEDKYISTVSVTEDMELLCWDVETLREALALPTNNKLSLALRRVLHGALCMEVSILIRGAAEKKKLSTYAHMLEVLLADEVVKPSEKKVMRSFRALNNISVRDHEHLLRSFGWSAEEYDDGGRRISLADQNSAKRRLTKKMSLKPSSLDVFARK